MSKAKQEVSISAVEAMLYDLYEDVEKAMHAEENDKVSTGLSRVATAIAALEFTRNAVETEKTVTQKAGADEYAERGKTETVTPRDPWEHIGEGKA